MSAWRQEWDEAAARGSGGGAGFLDGGVPYWTKRLLLANFAVFVALLVLGDVGLEIAHALSVDPDWWWLSAPFLPLWQVVTYGFVHDLNGFSHIIFNCLNLFFFGGMLERALGGRRFLTFYMVALVAGGILHSVVGQFGPFNGPVVGVSGGVMAILVAAAMLFPHTRVLLIVFPVPLWVVASGLVAMDLLSFGRYADHVAHHVHLIGALFGFLYIKQGWYKRDVVQVVQEKREAKVSRDRATDEARLDELLGRIGRDGMSSLSDSEKEFLKRMSKRS